MRRMLPRLDESWRMGMVGALLLALVAMGAVAQSTDAVQIEQNVQPEEIAVTEAGETDPAEVELTVIGPRLDSDDGPIDLMLALDRSASVDLARVQEIARTIVSHLGASDRVGIVSFADSARVEQELTPLGGSDGENRDAFTEIRETINGLVEGRQTALGDGLMLAVDELVDNARSEATRLIVTPTDGVAQVGRDPLVEAERAGENDIPIFAIGTTPSVRTSVLSRVGQASDGRFFQRYSDDALERIFREGDRHVAARYLLLTQTLPPTVSDVKGLENGPSILPGRDATQLQWRVPMLFEGEAWHTRYNVRFARQGAFELNQSPSQLEYTNPQGERVVVGFPESPTIQVGEGDGRPEEDPNEETDDGNGEESEDSQTEDDDGEDGRDDKETGDEGDTGVPQPALSASPSEALVGEAIAFDASGSSDPDDDIATYKWDWTNDGTIDNETDEATARHAYGAPGDYTVRVRVTDEAGNASDATVSVPVREGLPQGAPVTTSESAFNEAPTTPDWMNYYLDGGVVTDEEARDAQARFAADVFIPGTQYRMTNADVTAVVQLNQLDTRMNDFKRPSAAQDAGYEEVGPLVDGIGQAYVKQQFLMNRRPAFDEPPVLLYAEDAEGEMRLAGVRFVSRMEGVTLFQASDWSSRPAAAHFENGSEQAVSDPSNAPAENADGSPLAFWHPTLYGLQVWVGIPNPDGIFAPRHPRIGSE